VGEDQPSIGTKKLQVIDPFNLGAVDVNNLLVEQELPDEYLGRALSIEGPEVHISAKVKGSVPSFVDRIPRNELLLHRPGLSKSQLLYFGLGLVQIYYEIPQLAHPGPIRPKHISAQKLTQIIRFGCD
jgi:hypothetical protein